MGQQPGTGRPGLHIVFRERGPEQGAVPNHKNPRAEPPDHAIGRSRGGLTCKVHLVVDGKGRPRTRPDRVLADKGYPSKANRTWLRTRGIAATIPERDDQIAHRKKKPGRPIDFGESRNGGTAAATSSNGASTVSSNGAESRCAPTSSHATTAPRSASPPR